MHSFVVLMPSRAVTEGCRALSTGSYAETIDWCTHTAQRADKLTGCFWNVALKKSHRLTTEETTQFSFSYWKDMEVSTSGITRCYSQKCKQFLEEAPAGPHIMVKKNVWAGRFFYYYYYFPEKRTSNFLKKKKKTLKCYSTNENAFLFNTSAL